MAEHDVDKAYATEPRRRSVIEEYGQAADSLRDAVDELYVRLQTVLRPELPEPPTAERVMAVAEEPSEARRILDGLHYQRQRLALLLERLEV